jgi:hypothetical protein
LFKGCGFLSSKLPVLDPSEQTPNFYGQTLLQLVLVVGVAKSRLSGGVVRDFRALGKTSLLILEIDVFGRQQAAQ